MRRVTFLLAVLFLAPCLTLAQGKRRAVVVGVASFEHGYASLEYTARDARRTATALEDLGYSVSLLAADADAGEVQYADVLTALKNAAQKSQPGDTLLFFFAGHGSRRMNKDYLLLSDSDPDKFATTALALDTLSDIVASSKATRRVFVIDACRSTNRADGKTGFVNGKLDGNFKDALDKLVTASPANGDIQTAVLYACSPGETSKESIEERSGVFTQRFVQALQQPDGSTPITLGRILGFVRAHMPATLEQTPLLVGPDALLLGKRPANTVPTRPQLPPVQNDPASIQDRPKPPTGTRLALCAPNATDAPAWRHPDGKPCAWTVRNGELVVAPGSGNLVSRDIYRDFDLHIEFNLANMPNASGQNRSNSGVFLHGIYEVQILDSVNNPTYPGGGCGALYLLKDPDRNVCRPPGVWQTYDIAFRAPRFSSDGAVTEKPRITVMWNGVTVHNNIEIPSTLRLGGQNSLPERVPTAVSGPIMLQDHGAAVRFRNIWITPR